MTTEKFHALLRRSSVVISDQLTVKEIFRVRRLSLSGLKVRGKRHFVSSLYTVRI